MVLGVNGRTLGYILREKLQRKKIRGRVWIRAWGYEKRLERGMGSELARMCWKEMRRRAREGREVSDWERKRRKYFEDRGFRTEDVERSEEEEEG